MAALVCVACGHSVVDPRAPREERPGDPTAPPVRGQQRPAPQGLPDDLTLEEPVLSLEGLAALGEAGFESELEHLKAQRRKQLGMLALMGLGGIASVALVPLLVLGVGAVRLLFADGAPDGPALPPEMPVVEEPVDEPPEPEAPSDEEEGDGEEELASDAPAAEETDAELEEPEEAPEPAPAPAPADPVRTYIKQGWSVASRQPAEGAVAFRKALELSPGHAEASYGLGYCLLKQGDLDGATRYLCVARTSSKPDIRRDVDALLANEGLTCSP